MKKLILTLVTFLLVASTVQAQERVKATPKKAADAAKKEATAATSDSDWKTGGTGRAGFALNDYENWAAGVFNTTNLDANMDLFADYQKGKFTWSNAGKFGIGLVGSNAFVIEGNDETQFWRKSLDIFSVTSAIGYKFNDKLAWTLPVSFITQFAPSPQFQAANPALSANVSALNPSESSNVVGRFLSPAYLMAGTGIKWTPIPADNKIIEFWAEGLVQNKNTIVGDEDIARTFSLDSTAVIADNDTVGIYGNIIDKGNDEVQKIRPEFGVAANAFFAYKGIKNIVFSSKLGLFKNFVENEFNGITDPKNTNLALDVNWLNKIDFNVPIVLAGKTLNFTTTFEHQLIRDKDIAIFNRKSQPKSDGDGIQSRLFFGAGLTYQFGYKK